MCYIIVTGVKLSRMSRKENALLEMADGEKNQLSKRTMNYFCVEGVIGQLQGKVLTIMDAVIEKERSKATKDLLMDVFRWAFSEAEDIALYPDGYKKDPVNKKDSIK